MVLALLLCSSCLSLAAYVAQFRAAIAAIAQLQPLEGTTVEQQSLTIIPVVSVVVPAYNEADNIQGCITSVLDSTVLSQQYLEVWVVDDQSTDDTWAILKNLQQQRQDPRLHLLSGLPRPEAESWTGKNWACAQASQKARGEFLLFIDADVRLKPGAIAAAVQLAQAEKIDLLNGVPQVVCGSLVEWLVQPLIFISMVISFNQPAVRDPKQETAYAAGPFMLFRRSAYEQIGGHRAVAQEVAEDVALARAIKRHQLTLQHRLVANLASLRMYTSGAALWEGWTKVLYVGAWRSIGLMLLLAILMFNLYTMPWLGLGLLLIKGLIVDWSSLDGLSVGFILLSLGLQYYLRHLASQAFFCSSKYWWLQSIGGLLVGVMAIASVIKAETGWGWTWRGRALKVSSKPH
ncbi:MAG TPA: glycosyltransferase [Leptolyngbyaceae cyanobacterium M33_DOE_097]|uniref:Glycosyltransferase n=1 Tax=Oscillatoriales cyanobacterium SpSt-418 TaxID=2282169 RepID=A0A7C3PGU1_9CYAN|nr:glycosyltransferase [Leptolyngbyaceae cyanobacterium M33_DOE_097]